VFGCVCSVIHFDCNFTAAAFGCQVYFEFQFVFACGVSLGVQVWPPDSFYNKPFFALGWPGGVLLILPVRPQGFANTLAAFVLSGNFYNFFYAYKIRRWVLRIRIVCILFFA